MVVNISKKFLFLIFVFAIGFISAEFSLGNVSHSVETSYGVGENLSGWLNISFSGESSNSILKSSDGGEITLINLLDKNLNSGFEYNCTPTSCKSDYSGTAESSSKTFNLIAGQSALFGFRIIGDNALSDITSFKFDLISNNAETDFFPLSLDILNNEVQEWEAYTASENYGTENFGCFVNLPGQTSKAKIASVYYCETVELARAPAIEIGAYVDYLEGGTSVQFDMKIENADTGNSQTCTATATGTGRIACVPNYKIEKEGNYYVCIKTKSSADANKYEINYEQTNACGYSGVYNGIYDYDFEVFERSKNFASNINLTLNNTELSRAGSPTTNIENYIENYIAETYDNNCKSGCIIPVEINAGINQTITVSNARIIYVTGISRETNNFYDLVESPALINSGFQRLDFSSAGFSVSDKKETYAVSLSLDNEELFEQTIMVGDVPIIDYVTPTKTAIKYPTKFLAKVTSDLNVTQYKWAFGDGDSETTSENEISHTYDSAGSYVLMLTATNSAGRSSSKNFSITISPASQIVPTLLLQASENVASLEEDINGFAGFKKTSIQNAFDVGDIKDQLLVLKDSGSKASLESDYEAILEELLKMKIPLSVGETAAGQGIVFYPEEENINLEVLKEISGGSYSSGKDAEYREAILSWEVDNVNVLLSFNEISAIYDEYQEPAVRIFEISIAKTGEQTAYLVIRNMENLIFEGEYSATDYDGYKYITLTEGTQKIVLSTTEDLNFLTLPIFISPSLSEITLAEWSAFDDSGNLKQWILFTIISIAVIFGTFVVYIVLQIWYKRKYESYLFKDRNNLYNLINYVKSSRENGMKDKDIEKNLEKVGWTSEQMRYVMRKFAGKNTGLPEIPIKKILKEKK
jgi:PKD repeat protein